MNCFLLQVAITSGGYDPGKRGKTFPSKGKKMPNPSKGKKKTKKEGRGDQCRGKCIRQGERAPPRAVRGNCIKWLRETRERALEGGRARIALEGDRGGPKAL